MCQNQSIAESNAELAVDLRREINEQIRAGRSDQQIVDFMVARYGDFVLYRPPLKSHTWLLWFGPALLAIAALLAFMRALRNRRRRIGERPLTDAERAEAERLLGSRRSDGVRNHRRCDGNGGARVGAVAAVAAECWTHRSSIPRPT